MRLREAGEGAPTLLALDEVNLAAALHFAAPNFPLKTDPHVVDN